VRAKRGGDHLGASPVDRGKLGSKLHLVSERRGLPLTAAVTAANVNDTLLFEALLDDVPAVLTPAGRRRCRPGKIDADKAYDHAANRAYLRRRGITARIARRGIESSTRLGRQRGGSSGRCRGCRATGAWRSVGIEVRSGGSRSCCWPVRLSASSGSNPPTGAKRRLSAGVDLWTVAGRLEHGGGGATTLRVYASFVAAADRRAAEVLGQRHRPPSTDA